MSTTAKIKDLTPYARNSRTHSDEQVSQIAASIREFGFTAPVLYADGTVIAGHGRLMAAQRLQAAGQTVLDSFGGSGTTLIACEKTGRKARLMELDPKYVDVIVRRWQTLTGKRATLEATGQAFADVEADGAEIDA